MNFTHLTIEERYTDIDSAIAAAKANGNDIFGGYENNIPQAKRVNESLGVNEYLLADDGQVYFIASFDGQRVLNKLSLGASISDGSLCPAVFTDRTLSVRTDPCVHKSNKAGRREVCKNENIILVDERLAAEIAHS
jgi:hypothetical protein